MSQVKKNTLANYAGQAWTALMSVVFVPVYIRYVGIEAYGIIGFFIALQSLLAILDMGVSATLNRELARRSGTGSAQEIRDLVRTLEWICWPTAALIALLIWLLAGPAAGHWLRPDSFTVERAAHAIVLLGLAMALQWPASFYTGGLGGLQRQVLLNLLVAIFATIRGVGAVMVLGWISPTLEAFLWWQIVLSAAQSAVFALMTWRSLPRGERAPSFSSQELRRIGRFALGITGVTVVSFLLGNADRIVLSKILPLDQFGVYAFASSVAFAIMRFASPVLSAVYPRYSQLVAATDTSGLSAFYHRSNQVMSVAILPVAAIGALFAYDILFLWTGDAALSTAAAPILSLLIVGCAINALMNLPYALQLAHGWTSLSFWINVAAVCFLVPATWILSGAFGGVGAAAVWLVLNLGYLLIDIPLMHRRLLPDQMWRWYVNDVALPLVACTVVALAWRAAFPHVPGGIPGWTLLFVSFVTAVAGSVVVSPYPRSLLVSWWSKRKS